MEKITNILAKKQPHLHSVSPQASAGNALYRMCCENTDYLIVVDDNEQYIGLISEHDIASKVIYPHKPIDITTVGDVMNKILPFASTDDTVENCMKMMRRHHIRHLPVFDHLVFKGIVSSDDILEEAVFNRKEIFDTDAEPNERII